VHQDFKRAPPDMPEMYFWPDLDLAIQGCPSVNEPCFAETLQQKLRKCDMRVFYL
jgi:hypothetical protein